MSHMGVPSSAVSTNDSNKGGPTVGGGWWGGLYLCSACWGWVLNWAGRVEVRLTATTIIIMVIRNALACTKIG